uniref:Methyltransferase type 11 domain-containing protein n=1 Tax=Panthera leo TaxID=9689 RepID=A0A8C9CYU5_PANLE
MGNMQKMVPLLLEKFTVMYNEQMTSKKRKLFSNLPEFAGPSGKLSLLESVAENRHLQFERFVVAAGENMHQVADGSMDVVVCTLVLCSVQNQEQILQEVCRVFLSPGDALDFKEHTAAKRSSWNFSSQQSFSPNALEGAAFSQPTLQLPQAHWQGKVRRHPMSLCASGLKAHLCQSGSNKETAVTLFEQRELNVKNC